MIECSKCSGACEDNALYCVHCGARLNTKACKGCGDYVPEDVKFCAKCGHPTDGEFCTVCGNKNPDDAKFCINCGAALGARKPAQQPMVAPMPAVPVQQATPVRVAKPKSQGGMQFGFRVARMFVLPALLMCMFITSFFSMFQIYVPLLDVNADVTGFDAVRGMFLLINPPTEEAVTADFEDYFKKHANTDVKTEAAQKREIKKVINGFGTLRMCVYEENMSPDLILQVLVWGLQSLALILISFIFFIITLVHAINATLKRDGVYKHETMPLSLLAVIAFAFLLTGGWLGGASWFIFIFGLLGLGFITICKYCVEKMPKPALAVNLRRGICAGLVFIMAFFAAASVVNVQYEGIKGSLGTDDLYVAMDSDPFEDMSEAEIEELNSDNILKILNQLNSDYLTKSEKREYLELFAHPVVLCFLVEAVDSFKAPAVASSWLLFIFNMFFAAMLSILLYRELQDEANPEAKRKKNLLWYILTTVGVAGILGCSIPFIVMGNSISKDLEMGISYSISAFPIVAIIFAIGALVTYAVMKSLENGKNKPRPIYQPAYAPVPPAANNYVPPAPTYAPNPESAAVPNQDVAVPESATENQTAPSVQKVD